MKTLFFFVLLQLLPGDFPTWENCRKWIEAEYKAYFGNKPKTLRERIDWANTVYKKAVLNNDSLLLAEAYYLFGKIEFNPKKDYLKTKYWFLKCLAVQEKKGFSPELCRVYMWLGHNEETFKNYEQALTYFKKAAFVAESINNEDSKAKVYSHLVSFFNPNLQAKTIVANLNNAKLYLKKAKSSALKANDIGSITVLNIQESALDSVNNITLLEETIEKMDPRTDNGVYKLNALLALTQLYLDKDSLDLASQKLIETKKVFSKLSHFSDIKKSIDTTEVSLLVKNRNFEEAYFLLEKVRIKEIENWNNEKLKVIHNMDDQLNTLIAENQETELSLYRENILLQRKFLWVFALLIFITAITALLFFILNRKNKQISKQNALLVKEQNHRFNNNLQTISSLLTLKSRELSKNDPEEVFNESKLLIQAISSLQRKLYSSDKLTSVELHKLLPELVDEVLSAFNMSHVKTEYDIVPLEIYADDALNLNLIFTELTINACKHAFSTTANPALQISVGKKGESFHFTFKDNGKKELNLSKESFGIFLIKQLVKQMQGSHNFQGSMFEMICKLKLVT